MPDRRPSDELRIRYARGSGRLVVSHVVCALLPEDCPDTLVDALWELSTPDVLRVARTLLDAGAPPPDLAIAVIGEAQATVLVRGAATATAGDEVHTAEDVVTWREIVLPLEGLSLQLGPDAAAASLPLAGGVVSAAAVAWVADGPAPSARPPLTPPHDALPGKVDAHDEALGSLAPPPVPLSETLRPGEMPQLGAHEVPLADAASQDPHEAVGDPEDIDSYDRLFGATEHVSRRPSAAAVPDEAPPTMIEPSAVAPSVDAPSTSPATSVSARADGPALGGMVSSVPLISAVPGTAAPPAASIPPAPPLGDPVVPVPVNSVAVSPTDGPTALPPDDVSGLTIARSSLASLRNGPQVHGVHCPRGHANPVEAVVCRVCGIEVPPQSATTLTRPPLGALVALDVPPGAPTRVLLEGPLLLGRRPTLDGQSGPVPTLVTVASPDNDLSRNHLRVNLDGWHVLVTDLGSTNGTVVELPGEQPERIHPQRPTMITPGTRVTLADVATYVYEVSA